MAFKRIADVSYDKVVKMMIYGQAGTGKSTLALSAPNPVYIDFDGSGKRLSLVNDDLPTMYPTRWEDIKTQFTTDSHELAPFQSVVVDTAGKMMDMIISYRCGTRIPRIQDWGAINQEFSWFMRTLTELKKNVIIIAQRTTRDEGERTVFIPALRQKNLDAIISELDLLGYLEMKNDRGTQLRTITFDPTDTSEGKNCCNLKAKISIPVISNSTQNDFVSKSIIEPYVEMLKAKEDANKKYHELVANCRQALANVTDADSANMFVDFLKDVKWIGNAKNIIGAEFKSKVSSLGLTFNKETKLYEAAA